MEMHRTKQNKKTSANFAVGEKSGFCVCLKLDVSMRGGNPQQVTSLSETQELDLFSIFLPQIVFWSWRETGRHTETRNESQPSVFVFVKIDLLGHKQK